MLAVCLSLAHVYSQLLVHETKTILASNLGTSSFSEVIAYNFLLFLHARAVVADVLLFQNYLFQKQSRPFSIPEGQQSVYTVRLDGPPPSDVEITLNAADNFIRFITRCSLHMCIYTINTLNCIICIC